MHKYKIGDKVPLADGDHVIEGLKGSLVRIRNVHTGNMQILHPSALSRLLDVPPIFNADEPAPRDLALLDDDERERVETLARHMREVIEGSGDIRYNPDKTNLTGRVNAKVDELSASEQRVSVRSLFRQIAMYKEYGAAGLVDGRKKRVQKPLGGLDSRVLDVLVEVIADQTNKSSISATSLIAQVRREVILRYPGQQVPFPSESTMRRRIEALTKGKHTVGSAPTRRSAANVPNRMFNGRPAIAPGHEVQIDTSPFDVLVLDDKGDAVRAKLTIALDKATMSIIASSINISGVKGVDLAFMLSQCLLPRPARPNEGRLPQELELSQMPWAKHLTNEELQEYDLHRPFIKPQRIITDGGKEYLSETFRSACQTFGIDLTRSAVRTPTDKPNVERAFHTIKTMLLEKLPGFTGGSVDRRGLNPENEGLLTVYELAELFDRWVSVVWQNRPHEALRDPINPKLVHSPNSMYMAMFDMTGYVPVPIHVDDYISLLPTVVRSIQTDGIQVNYRRYDSIHLNPFRLQKSGRADLNGGWEVHYNPHNPDAVWVRDPETTEWIECAWMNKDAFKRPFSASIRRKAREITKAHGVVGDSEATELAFSLLGATKNERDKREHEERTRRSEQRLAEVSGKRLPTPQRVVVDAVAPEEDEDDSYEEITMFDPTRAVK